MRGPRRDGARPMRERWLDGARERGMSRGGDDQPGAGPLVTPRIAILDDERRMVDILEMILRREGYEVPA